MLPEHDHPFETSLKCWKWISVCLMPRELRTTVASRHVDMMRNPASPRSDNPASEQMTLPEDGSQMPVRQPNSPLNPPFYS